MLFYFLSLRYLSAGPARIVFYTYPVPVVGRAVAVLSESLTLVEVLALVGVLLGVAMTVEADTAGVESIGVGLALGAACCYAVYTIGSRTLVAEPLVTVAFGVVLLGEPMTASMILRGLIGLGGVVLVQRHRPSEQGPGSIART